MNGNNIGLMFNCNVTIIIVKIQGEVLEEVKESTYLKKDDKIRES